MSGRSVAEVQWRALDREGADRCRLAQVDHGWLLVGHARFRDADGFAALDYVVRCDADWHTLGADVAGRHDEREIRLALHRTGEDWEMNEEAQPQVAGATDLDLAFTPATNLMPLMRLAAAKTKTMRPKAAWLRYPACELSPLDQTYRRTDTSGIVSYAADQTGYATQLVVDRSGFVTLYPGAWEGEVDHATP